MTVSKAGPYYSSGEIKFSSLRSNFRAQQRKDSSSVSEIKPDDFKPISASELIRNTSVIDTNPIVPDCTENENAGIVDTELNWKTSQFRNSIKYYYYTLTGTNTGVDLGAFEWNSNIPKNIHKILFVDGLVGSTDNTAYAATFDEPEAYNFTIDVFGSIQGAGGTGGDASTISGSTGGSALLVNPTTANNVTVNVRSTANIYAGGGGGEKGATGGVGNTGTCWNYSYNTVPSGCNKCGDCGSGWDRYGGCNDTTDCDCAGWWLWYGCRHKNKSPAECRQQVNYAVAGGPGGAGGNGGTGRGYDNMPTYDVDGNDISLKGADGAGGTAGSCSGYTGTTSTPGTGITGETGGSGGEWGKPGGDTNNTGDGGVTGAAIYGSNYTVTGTVNSTTVKGASNPI